MMDTIPVKPPRISIVTITRNSSEFLEETIRSVQEQTYEFVEYIVIDAGSTDGTVDIIRKYERGIVKWLSEPDEGIADGFNKGLSYTTGDYVLFLNSDDALSNPQVLEKIAEQMINLHFPSIIYGDCNVLERESGKFLYRAAIEFDSGGLKEGRMIPHPSMFASRDYFSKYGFFDCSFRIAMDFEWLLRGALTDRVEHVPVLVSNVRTGGVSARSQHQVVDEIILALRKHGYVASEWGEQKMRNYFRARSLAKYILARLGVYELFSRMRNKS